MPDFNQADIQQIASLVASQVVEQLKVAGYQTRDADPADRQTLQGSPNGNKQAQQGGAKR